MEKLSDLELIDAYLKAKELNCSPEFIQLLLQEIKKRNIEDIHNDYQLQFI